MQGTSLQVMHANAYFIAHWMPPFQTQTEAARHLELNEGTERKSNDSFFLNRYFY